MSRFFGCVSFVGVVMWMLLMAPCRADDPPLPAGLGDEAPPLPSGLGGGDEPALPSGLGNTGEPSLPAGLAASNEPSLPQGLGPDTNTSALDTEKSNKRRLPREITGFFETRIGLRTQEDPYEKDASLTETRLQLQYEKSADKFALRLTADLVYDDIPEEHEIDLESGEGWLDLRRASLLWRPTSFLDVTAGRQVLTWGTGDLLFINDLFPKDWNSFFIGRDDEYLKALSDALKLAFFTPVANLDVVYTPRFDNDRFIDGSRISYWNDSLGRQAGRDAVVTTDQPDRWFHDDEVALRLYRTFGAYEAALYAYDGFWKSPAGMDAASGKALFPSLSVYGASLRGPAGKGILSLEAGWYRSGDDLDGDDPLLPNSQARFLIGYEQELARNLTGAMQYYVEAMQEHDAYQASLPAGMKAADAYRQVLTLRLTKMMMAQNLRLSLFAYYSPTDRDAYLRPNVNYKVNDQWTVEAGGNVFLGEDRHTFFGQFDRDTNIYAGVRFGF